MNNLYITLFDQKSLRQKRYKLSLLLFLSLLKKIFWEYMGNVIKVLNPKNYNAATMGSMLHIENSSYQFQKLMWSSKELCDYFLLDDGEKNMSDLLLLNIN